MGLDLVTLRAMIWKPLGMDTDNESDLLKTDIDSYLNRSFWALLNRFPFREKERYAEFNCTIGQRSYDMPSGSEALRSLSIIKDDNHHYDLQQITVDDYESKYDQDTEEWAQPIEYVREYCLFRLWPTPDKEYTMVLRRLVILADLSDSNNEPEIPQEWHEIIGYGGLWRALIDKGDIARATIIKQTQAALINGLVPVQVKEEGANIHRSGLQVLGRDY